MLGDIVGAARGLLSFLALITVVVEVALAASVYEPALG
jgi:hypothetical protein